MEKLQSLQIPWTSEIHPLLMICSRLKELIITDLGDTDTMLTEWAKKGFIPQTLSITIGDYFLSPDLVQFWSQLNRSSPTDYTSYFKVYHHYKHPIDLLITPIWQLQFGQTCTLPLVQASKYGLLGLEVDVLLLSNRIYGNKELHKAVVAMTEGLYGVIPNNLFTNDIKSLSFLVLQVVNYTLDT